MTVILDPLLGFEHTLQVNYSSHYDAILFGVICFIACLLYFYDKLKHPHGIQSYKLLAGLSASFTIGAYITPKIIQTYNPMMVGMIISVTICVYFTIVFLQRKELPGIYRRGLTKHSLSLTLFSVAGVVIGNLVATILPAEIYTIIKRAMTLLANIITGTYRKHRITASYKDKLIIFVFVIIAVIYTMK